MIINYLEILIHVGCEECEDDIYKEEKIHDLVKEDQFYCLLIRESH
jgi:hypothetical protein